MSEEIYQNDHDLLIRIDTRIQDLARDNSDFKASLSKLENKKCDKEDADIKFGDIELRLRKIERYVWLAIGGLFLIEFILKANS